MADNSMPGGTEIVFERLKAAAAAPRLVTYGELADAAGVLPRVIGRRLDDIHTRLCQKTPGRLGWSSSPCRRAAACRARTSLARRGKNISLNLRDLNERAWWRAMVLHVFATDWSRIECQVRRRLSAVRQPLSASPRGADGAPTPTLGHREVSARSR